MLKTHALPLFLMCCLAFAAPFSSHAALRPSGQGGQAASDPCNPQKAPGDILLPMPKGLTMAFRAVAIPAKGVLYDKRFSMGVSQPDGERKIYESRRDAYVSAPFRQEDLPAQWRKILPADEAGAYMYYFIGKYEVTNAQWQAVMEDGSPSQGADAAKPKTGISWYDMQQFLCRYNQWLMDNHARSLPSIDGSPAYLRLPFEEEWEFAARGGNLPPEKLNYDDFPLEEGKSVEDYAVFGTESPSVVGTKNPNPLGLYDMAGNAAEPVESAFRFTVADSEGGGTVRRLHGAQGGLVSKGGSFLSSDETAVYPGKRIELSVFGKADGGGRVRPYAARNLGMRLVLTNLNVPGDKRAREINAEFSAMSGQSGNAPQPAPAAEKPADGGRGKDRLVTLDAHGTPLSELDKVIAAAGSPFMQSNLAQLRDIVVDSNMAREREKDAAVLGALRSGVYMAEVLRGLAFRCWNIPSVIKNQAEKLDKKSIDKLYEQMFEHFSILDASTKYYMLGVQQVANLPAPLVQAKFVEIKKEYGGKDSLSKRMRENISAFEKHVSFVRAKGPSALTVKRVQEDVIPPVHLKGIQEALARRKN